jgi:hypothetical protein
MISIVVVMTLMGTPRPKEQKACLIADIEQVKNAKKSFTFRWMLRQITFADSGKGQ